MMTTMMMNYLCVNLEMIVVINEYKLIYILCQLYHHIV